MNPDIDLFYRLAAGNVQLQSPQAHWLQGKRFYYPSWQIQGETHFRIEGTGGPASARLQDPIELRSRRTWDRPTLFLSETADVLGNSQIIQRTYATDDGVAQQTRTYHVETRDQRVPLASKRFSLTPYENGQQFLNDVRSQPLSEVRNDPVFPGTLATGQTVLFSRLGHGIFPSPKLEPAQAEASLWDIGLDILHSAFFSDRAGLAGKIQSVANAYWERHQQEEELGFPDTLDRFQVQADSGARNLVANAWLGWCLLKGLQALNDRGIEQQARLAPGMEDLVLSLIEQLQDLLSGAFPVGEGLCYAQADQGQYLPEQSQGGSFLCSLFLTESLQYRWRLPIHEVAGRLFLLLGWAPEDPSDPFYRDATDAGTALPWLARTLFYLQHRDFLADTDQAIIDLLDSWPGNLENWEPQTAVGILKAVLPDLYDYTLFAPSLSNVAGTSLHRLDSDGTIRFDIQVSQDLPNGGTDIFRHDPFPLYAEAADRNTRSLFYLAGTAYPTGTLWAKREQVFRPASAIGSLFYAFAYQYFGFFVYYHMMQDGVDPGLAVGEALRAQERLILPKPKLVSDTYWRGILKQYLTREGTTAQDLVSLGNLCDTDFGESADPLPLSYPLRLPQPSREATLFTGTDYAYYTKEDSPQRETLPGDAGLDELRSHLNSGDEIVHPWDSGDFRWSVPKPALYIEENNPFYWQDVEEIVEEGTKRKPVTELAGSFSVLSATRDTALIRLILQSLTVGGKMKEARIIDGAQAGRLLSTNVYAEENHG